MDLTCVPSVLPNLLPLIAQMLHIRVRVGTAYVGPWVCEWMGLWLLFATMVCYDGLLRWLATVGCYNGLLGWFVTVVCYDEPRRILLVSETISGH